jgi:pantetheine-phosphate adenylyltransferase
MKKKIAIYPGSFNPFTIGHLNILEKAEATFGKENVIIAIGKNSSKEESSVDRAATIKHNLPSRNVEKYDGLLTEYIWEKEKEGYDVTLIRGLRNGFDLQYETNLLRALQDYKPDLQVIFYLCDKQFDHVSSSLYREAEKGKPGAGHRYLAVERTTEYDVTKYGQQQCVVYVDDTKTDIIEKYLIRPTVKVVDETYKFSGSYIECLTWIKEQEK